jgi:thiosulfate dehydrogenase [quinone] large subunit
MSNTNASSRGRDGVTATSPPSAGTHAAHSVVAETPTGAAVRYVAAILRIGLGWIFLWAFLDKLFGLGYATEKEASWLEGGSPTEGYLNFATKGPFADAFQSLAGYAVVDWLFMLGLAGVGIALMVGAGVRIAAVAGSMMLLMMWAAALWPENNPFLDDHLIYIGVLALIALLDAGRTLGIGGWWQSLPFVQRYSWLK